MQGYKTIITAATAAIAAILGWLTGTIPGDQAFLAVWGLLIVIFARMGVDLKIGGWLAGYKTKLTAVIGMVGAIGTYAAGKLDLPQTVTALVMGFIAIFGRDAIRKAVPGSPGN